MKNSCIVAPIHEPRFESFGLEFVRTYNDHFDDDHLFLVFTNEKEKDLFAKVANGLRYRSIVCTEKITYSKPITQKKIFGVRWVFNNTEFDKVAVIDVDCRFIKHIDYDVLFQNHLDKKSLLCSTVNNKGMVEKVGKYTCKKFFSPDDVAKVSQLTKDFTSYFWFNEPPIYDKKRFAEFLDYINYDKIIPQLEYVTFDYIMFAYYLLVKDEIQLNLIDAPVQDKGSFLEAQEFIKSNYFVEIFNTYKPMWIKNLIHDEDMPNVFIQMHTDRK